jgi:hypothetical protein
MPTGLITEYHAVNKVGLIRIDGQADDTFVAFQKSDCTARLQAQLTNDIPNPNPRLHIRFDPGTDSDPNNPGSVLPIAINVDLTDDDALDFGTNNRIEALMAVKLRGQGNS